MFVDKSSKRVSMRYLQFLRDLRECSTYAWGAALLDNLYREMCIATYYNAKSIGDFTLLIQLWAWKRCPTLAPSFISPQQQNAPLAYRYTFLYYFELIINKYAWLMLIIILCNILFCYLFFLFYLLLFFHAICSKFVPLFSLTIKIFHKF